MYGRKKTPDKLSKPVHDEIKKIKRQMLHAGTLGFVHPSTGEYLEFSSPIPDDMRALIDIISVQRVSVMRDETIVKDSIIRLESGLLKHKGGVATAFLDAPAARAKRHLPLLTSTSGRRPPRERNGQHGIGVNGLFSAA